MLLRQSSAKHEFSVAYLLGAGERLAGPDELHILCYLPPLPRHLASTFVINILSSGRHQH